MNALQKTALVAVCASTMPVAPAAESGTLAELAPRLTAELPIVGRFHDQQYLFIPAVERGAPLIDSRQSWRFIGGPSGASGSQGLTLRLRPTGLIEELLHSRPVQQPPLLPAIGFPIGDSAGWSGVSITSTVGE